jgi:two-component system chemotaxis sensor kinase CheA
VAHAGESLLCRLRDGELAFSSAIANALLGVVDAVRQFLARIEASRTEGDADHTDLIQSLQRLHQTEGTMQPSRETASSPTAGPGGPRPKSSWTARRRSWTGRSSKRSATP